MSNASSRAWSWRHAFAGSDLPATTKHVLHTLGMFMNELGEGCYPSVADICRYSGLDKKTVLKHLAAARDAGWIAISQHGYRGQKWKRNEYAARWPGRDVVAPCPPSDGPEGGGAAPPPCEGQEAVDSAPERGGTEGSKVVEEIHQDKTSPVTPPITTPSERERASADEREGEDGGLQTDASDRQSRAALERRFWKLARNHPQSAGMPKDAWKVAWLKLSPDEQDRAEARYPAWLALLKRQRKDHVPALSTYFAQKLFDEVPDEPEAAKPSVPRFEPPFGPAFAVAVWRDLVSGPKATPPPLKAWEEDMVRSGKIDRERMERDYRARYGWPAVNRLLELGVRRATNIEAGSLDHLKHLVEAVPVHTENWEAWKLEHEKRGWPWAEAFGYGRVMYFPKGGPGGLEAFERAMREAEEKGGGDEHGNRSQAAE